MDRIKVGKMVEIGDIDDAPVDAVTSQIVQLLAAAPEGVARTLTFSLEDDYLHISIQDDIIHEIDDRKEAENAIALSNLRTSRYPVLASVLDYTHGILMRIHDDYNKGRDKGGD